MRKERGRMEGGKGAALYLESSPPAERQKKSVRHTAVPPPPDAPDSVHPAALHHSPFVMSQGVKSHLHSPTPSPSQQALAPPSLSLSLPKLIVWKCSVEAPV